VGAGAPTPPGRGPRPSRESLLFANKRDSPAGAGSHIGIDSPAATVALRAMVARGAGSHIGIGLHWRVFHHAWTGAAPENRYAGPGFALCATPRHAVILSFRAKKWVFLAHPGNLLIHEGDGGGWKNSRTRTISVTGNPLRMQRTPRRPP